MGIRDELIKTAHPIEDYRIEDAKDHKTLSNYTKAQKSFGLPPPFNKKTAVKEAKIQKDILLYLAKKRIVAWRIEGGGKIAHTNKGAILLPSSMKGLPDILGITPSGYFFGIEVKQPGGRLSALQWQRLQDIKNNNGFAGVGCSTDIVDLLIEWYQEDLNYPNNKIGVFVA